MKKLASFIVATLVFCTFVSAQSPQAIPFQAIVRDTNNVILPNQGMAIRIDILSGSPTGTLLYQEIQSATTNSLGLLNLSIGQGAAQTGTITGINWGSGPIYVEIEVDLSGGSNFTELGVTQLQSVPYALYALNGGGGTAQPSGQITYGSGSGVTSDGGFIRNPVTQQTIITDNYGSQGSTKMRVDSTKILMTYSDNASGDAAGFFSGSAYPDWNLNSICVASVVYDQANQIKYGYYAVADSSQMVTGATIGGAVVGTKLYSAYMDVAMVENPNSPCNSLTVDTNGLHWEYGDTDRYSFPNTDGAPGQVLSTDGSGHLAWVTGGGGLTQPFRQIPYAGSGGLISDNNFFRDSTLQLTRIICSPPGSSYESFVSIDSFQAGIGLYDATTGFVNLITAGHEAEFGFAPNTVCVVTIDGNKNVMHGFYGMSDSTEMLTSELDSNGNYSTASYYGLVGTRAWSSYMDVEYNNGSSLNTLTLDSLGIHWEYNDTDRYTLPLTDGTTGQVITTNGAGVLTFTTIPATSNAWNVHQILPGNGTVTDTITLQNNKNNIYNPASSVTSLSVILPTSPNDGDMFILTFEGAVSSITYKNGTTGNGALTSATASQQKTYTYDASSSTWF